jgi:hypothetical protein
MQASSLKNANANARVWDHFDVKGIGHSRNLHELADSSVANFRLNDGHAALLQTGTHFVDRAPLFAQSQRNFYIRTNMRLTFYVFWLAWCFNKGGRVLVDRSIGLLLGQ